MLPGSLITFYVGAGRVPDDITVDALIVAGGAGSTSLGGDDSYTNLVGGGGAGGRLLQTAINVEGGINHTITVGGGGTSNTNGSSSVAFSNTAIGGGNGDFRAGDFGGVRRRRWS